MTGWSLISLWHKSSFLPTAVSLPDAHQNYHCASILGFPFIEWFGGIQMETLNQFSPICEKLGQMIGGKGKMEGSVCVLTVKRKDIQATIASTPFHSLEHMFQIEASNLKGESLITGEMVLLESEVPAITNYLTNSGIVVSAIHSHWLFDNPKLMYLHLLTISPPEKFVEIISKIV